MSQEGNDLFEIMDSALKRQREAGGAHQRSESRRASAAAAGGSAPASAPAGAPGPAQFAGQAPPLRNTITQRFNQLPDMAKTAPAPGSLSPSQVLRGTVFSGAHARTEGAAPAPAAPPAPVQPAAAPPPPPAAAKTGPVRISGVQPLAAGVVKTGRPSGVIGVLRPSVAQPEPPAPPPPPPVPAAPAPAPAVAPPASGSGLYRAATGRHAPVAQPSAQGFFVRTPWAVTAVLFVTIGLGVAFWAGYRAGLGSARTKGASGKGISKPPVADSSLRPVADLERRLQPPVVPPPPPPPPPAPKYTVQIKNFWAVNRADAERLAAELRSRGGVFAGTRVIEKGAPGAEQFVVCVGRFDLKAQAERLLPAVLQLPERCRRDPRVVQE